MNDAAIFTVAGLLVAFTAIAVASIRLLQRSQRQLARERENRKAANLAFETFLQSLANNLPLMEALEELEERDADGFQFVRSSAYSLTISLPTKMRDVLKPKPNLDVDAVEKPPALEGGQSQYCS
jgi:hypothetical protein